jgi:hypothetical protein
MRHPLYFIWSTMRRRCLNPKAPDFKHYGGRGITVCDAWATSFAAFVADIEAQIGGRPSSAHELDRIDNGRGYEPGNVRWSTRLEQVRNRRNTRFVTFDGVTRSVPEWADLVGLRHDTLYHRLYSGWTVERALTTPLLQARAA